jgi:hypothetical protein
MAQRHPQPLVRRDTVIDRAHLRLVRDAAPAADEPRRSQHLPDHEEWVARFVAQLERDRAHASVVITWLLISLAGTNGIWLVLLAVRKGWID